MNRNGKTTNDIISSACGSTSQNACGHGTVGQLGINAMMEALGKNIEDDKMENSSMEDYDLADVLKSYGGIGQTDINNLLNDLKKY